VIGSSGLRRADWPPLVLSGCVRARRPDRHRRSPKCLAAAAFAQRGSGPSLPRESERPSRPAPTAGRFGFVAVPALSRHATALGGTRSRVCHRRSGPNMARRDRSPRCRLRTRSVTNVFAEFVADGRPTATAPWDATPRRLFGSRWRVGRFAPRAAATRSASVAALRSKRQFPPWSCPLR